VLFHLFITFLFVTASWAFSSTPLSLEEEYKSHPALAEELLRKIANELLTHTNTSEVESEEYKSHPALIEGLLRLIGNELCTLPNKLETIPEESPEEAILEN
jgi:hypothetical protein